MSGIEQCSTINCVITHSGTPQRWRVLIATFLAYFYDSYCMLAISIAMPVILGVLNITKSQGGMLTSALMVGAMAGSLFMGTIAENKGRKFTLVLCLTWFGVALIPIIFIHNFLFWLVILHLRRCRAWRRLWSLYCTGHTTLERIWQIESKFFGAQHIRYWAVSLWR